MERKCFFERVTDDPINAGGGGKKFIEIALSRTISKIIAFLCFTQKIQDGCQKWQEIYFWKKCQMTLRMPWSPKIVVSARSHTVPEINVFLR